MTTNPILKFDFFGEHIDLVPAFGYYDNGRLAVQLLDAETGEPFTTVTVNMPEVHLNDDEVLVKDWSENTDIVQVLVRAGWLVNTGREVSSGYIFPKVMRMAGPLAAAASAYTNPA